MLILDFLTRQELKLGTKSCREKIPAASTKVKKQRRQQAEQSVRLQLCHQTQTQTHIHQTVCFHNAHYILHEIEVCEELIKTNRTSMETGLKGARWASGELQLLGLTHRVIIFSLFSLLKNYLSSCRMSTVLTAALQIQQVGCKGVTSVTSFNCWCKKTQHKLYEFV